MIEQIRHLQSQQPFETFAIELGNGCVIQIRDRHQVATTEGARYWAFPFFSLTASR
jgi:hypothetical protein